MMRRTAPWVVALLLSCLSVSLHSMPLFVSGDAGLRRTPVQVSLVDQQTVQFESATIEVLFDPAYLRYTGAALGELLDDDPDRLFFSLEPNETEKENGVIIISLATGSAPIDSASGGELLRVTFEILDSAPLGDTEISFQCKSPTATGADSCDPDLDYPIPLSSGFVTVLPSSASVSAPSSLILLALGLLAIPAFRR